MQTLNDLETRNAVRQILPAPLRALERLQWNYWWGWAADGAATFRDLDPETWEICEHNPRRLLREVSAYRLAQMATTPSYTERVQRLGEEFDRYLSEQPAAIAKVTDESSEHDTDETRCITTENPVAYFCAEYGIHNSLPLYSGGLGMLAGDHLKSASDLNVPLVAIGLLYRYGYFRQRLARDGWQEEQYGEVMPEDFPIEAVKDEEDKPLLVEVEIRGRVVKARVWLAHIGRIKLYLLDTNTSENAEVDRLITGHLYGGDRETRIVQEMMLGIGGVRLLEKLNITPRVFHLNEGHSAFLTLELARTTIKEQGINFQQAVPLVRERCVFTTHTPVAAGNDEFAPELVTSCFSQNYIDELGLSYEELLKIGRVDTTSDTEWFGMTPLAIKMSRSTNGVSRKHMEVSRKLWHELWDGKDDETKAPITHVTNGVHAPTWVAPPLRHIYEQRIGKDWTQTILKPEQWAQGVDRITDEELWEAHGLLKQRLVHFVRERTFHARIKRSESREYAEAARTLYDPQALTIGFARRIAAYKRWSLLLTDAARLHRLIENTERPVQFVFAGKAHPQDTGAKMILQRLAQWKLDPQVMQRAVFLENYDQEIARHLVQGVDVWLNVPRRPLEASGTSGQKVAMNGGLNLSVLDGWWVEGFDGTNGWRVGDQNSDNEAEEVLSDAEDVSDAESLYRVLEEDVVPLYYERDREGLPRRWIERMKNSIKTLAPAFNSDRMVNDYRRNIYE